MKWWRDHEPVWAFTARQAVQNLWRRFVTFHGQPVEPCFTCGYLHPVTGMARLGDHLRCIDCHTITLLLKQAEFRQSMIAGLERGPMRQRMRLMDRGPE